MPNLLLVEDEINLGVTLEEYLRSKGHEISWANSAAQARLLFEQNRPQIVLMDIGLPDGNGLELAKEFRLVRKDFVLLFLSAQNDPETRLQGLEIGADDYIIKPFQLKELMLRLNKILSIQEKLLKTPEEFSFGPLKLWPKRFEVQDAEGVILSLGQKENSILQLLIERSPEVVSRDEMMEKIWGEESYPTQRTIDNYIVRLRKWAETDVLEHVKIHNVRGIGYKLEIKR